MDDFDFDFDDFDDSLQITTRDNLESPKKTTLSHQHIKMVNGFRKQNIIKLLPQLPPTGTDLYIIASGAIGTKNLEGFDFSTLITHFVDLLIDPIDLYVSAWSMGDNHVNLFDSLLNANIIKSLVLFTDPSLKRRKPHIFSNLVKLQNNHPHLRFMAFNNHAKIVLMAKGDYYISILSSANFSSAPRCEQYHISTHEEVYHFYRTHFFEYMLNK
jgi:hypothetical protein